MRKRGIAYNAIWVVLDLWMGLASHRAQLAVVGVLVLVDIAMDGVLDSGWFYLIGLAVGSSIGYQHGMKAMADYYEKR